jgi:glycosyltransferase involved in cell wall biosynthesis
MKRILVLNYEFPPLGRGASPVSYELAEQLSTREDFDIDVVTMGFKGLPKYEEVNPHFRVHRVPCLRSKKGICHPWEQATYLVTGYLKAAELVKKKKYDLCHCHFIIPVGDIALRLKKRFGLRYVITAHGSDVLGYNARFKALYPLLVGRWKKILDNADRIISPSNFLKGEILNVYSSFDSEKIVVIPNGFDTSKFTPQPKKNWIFSSGALLPNKGFQHLIKAVSDEDIGYEVHIAGDGPMMGELKALAEKSKTKIVFHGWLDNKGREYKDLLEQSAIYVLASEKENASIALLEAMSAGCAVITTNVSGCPETVGEAGMLVEFGDHAGIHERIVRLIDDQEEVCTYQRLANERVKAVFGWNVIGVAYAKQL